MMIYPVRRVFITAIDIGLRYPMYLYNSNGELYPITKPYQMITHFDTTKEIARLTESKGLKKRINSVEKNWIRTVNEILADHVISRCPDFSVLAVEDIKGFDTKRTKNPLSWTKLLCCYDLYSRLANKASMRGIEIVRVDPYNTSNTCPICGNIDKRNRDKSKHIYSCNVCGLTCNDDGVAAWNIHNAAYRMVFT